MMSGIKVVKGLFLCASLFAGQMALGASPQHWQDERYISDSFIRIALEREYKETNHPTLVKWTQPIRVFMRSDAGNASLQRQLLTVHMQHLGMITGHPIDFVTTPDQANIFVVFTKLDQVEATVRQYIGDPDRIRAALDEAICLGNFKINRKKSIQNGTIIIPVDYARQRGRFLDCIVEEITQLLGLPNDSDEVYPSIFNDLSVDSYLSPLDYLLLKILYSDKLVPGMTPDQVRQILPSIVTQLKANGDIDQAAQRVYQHSLRQFVGE